MLAASLLKELEVKVEWRQAHGKGQPARRETVGAGLKEPLVEMERSAWIQETIRR